MSSSKNQQKFHDGRRRGIDEENERNEAKDEKYEAKDGEMQKQKKL